MKISNENHYIIKLKKLFKMNYKLVMPSFLVLGTQKGGTTTLHKLLKQDNRIFLPECKEVHYFSIYFNKGTKWYSSNFKDSTSSQLCGEITPYYLFHPDSAIRIKKILPKVKLIVLLRDPVERALSQYFHAKRNGFESLQIEAALDAEQERILTGGAYSHQKHSYVSRGYYLDQLDRYEKKFPQDNLLILKSEDLFIEPRNIWNKIQDFLKLSRSELPNQIIHANSGAGESKNIHASIKMRLRKEFKTTVLGVRKRYGFDWGW